MLINCPNVKSNYIMQLISVSYLELLRLLSYLVACIELSMS